MLVVAPDAATWPRTEREEDMRKTTIAALAACALTLSAGGAFADPILGNWKTQSGETAAIGKCGSAYCIVLKTGKYAGKQIGKLAGGGGTYEGNIIDPADDKTYSGSAKVAGAGMKLKGCVAMVLCKTQNWSKL
jgi:uncharacterized protein (DUF2147 family)